LNDFKDTPGDDYEYDLNGNLTKDNNKGIEIEYNFLNLPKKITFDDNSYMQYIYTTDGRKIKTLFYEGTGASEAKTTDYCGAFIYENDELSFINIDGGRILNTEEGLQYQFYITDHLGNVRVMYDEAGEILQEDHYYPFGMTINSLSYQAESLIQENDYLYNGKELQTEGNLGWYDYGARYYDPVIGRWHSIDPLAESYSSMSPYNYANNNPILFIDPNGMASAGYQDERIGAGSEVNMEYQKYFDAQRAANNDNDEGDDGTDRGTPAQEGHHPESPVKNNNPKREITKTKRYISDAGITIYTNTIKSSNNEETLHSNYSHYYQGSTGMSFSEFNAYYISPIASGLTYVPIPAVYAFGTAVGTLGDAFCVAEATVNMVYHISEGDFVPSDAAKVGVSLWGLGSNAIPGPVGDIINYSVGRKDVNGSFDEDYNYLDYVLKDQE